MSAAPPIRLAVDADGIGWLEFDDPRAPVNILNTDMQEALADALNRAQDDARLKAVVLTSGKERVFLAGADLNTVAGFPDAAAAREFSRRGQRLLQRVAEFRVPVVAALHGVCAGGGFEIALACRWRIATDTPVTRIGLPETSLGTIPGWGGTVRLPRLIGVKRALDHLLKAQLVAAPSAFEAGMIDELVPAGELRLRSREAALRLAAEDAPRAIESTVPDSNLFAQLRESVVARTGGHQPALLAVIDLVEKTARMALPDALRLEARVFGEISAGVTCKNLIRVFFLRESAKKRTLDDWFPNRGRADAPALPAIRRVGVAGAGVMGSGIAHWMAAHGLEVVLRDVSTELIDRGLAVVRRLFDAAVRQRRCTAGEANSAFQRIAVTTGWEGFERCDLVIEAIVENTPAKQRLFSEVAAIVPPTTILASNTSALPIEEIAGHVPQPGRTLGIHFFNPVSRLALVELILGRETSREQAERVLALVQSLEKFPVVCRAAPGFLVTRVLFFYLNAAVRQGEEGTAPGEIDRVLREFGWPMGPFRLIDEVGVDVTDAIFRELEHYYPQRFTRTTTCERLLARNLLGRKNGTSSGFYRYEGRTERLNEDVFRLLESSTIVPGGTTTAAERTIERVADALMRVMIDEAQRCLDEGVVKSADEVDFALLSGAGFPAFRGGLMHWARGPLSPSNAIAPRIRANIHERKREISRHPRKGDQRRGSKNSPPEL